MANGSLQHTLCLIALCLFTHVGLAQVTWDGGAATNLWSDGANWNPDGVPGDADDVEIDGNYAVSVTSSDSCNSVTIISADANNNSVYLIIESGARLGVGGDVVMDDRDRSNNRAVIQVLNGSTLNVDGDLYMTKDGGSSNNNDMLLQVYDDDSRVLISGDLIADFSVNNNNANDMGIRMRQDAAIEATNITVSFGSSQEADTLIAMNVGGAAGDSAYIHVTNDITISNNSGNMDCIIAMDYEATMDVDNSFSYSATAGEGFYWYIDRDAIVDVTQDIDITKDGNEEVYIYLNQNNEGSADDAQVTVGGDFEINKTDGDDLFISQSGHSDFTVTGSLIVNTSNEDDNGDDVVVTLNDDAGMSIGDDMEFSLNDGSQVDLLIQLNDNSVVSITDSFSLNQTNATFFELEMNSASSMSVGTDFVMVNTTSSDFPVIDMEGTASLTVGEDLIWTDNNTDDSDDSGFFLDGDASISVTDTFRINKTDDGDLFFNLNQTTDGSSNDARITAATFYVNKTDGDDLTFNMSNHSDIITTGDFIINTTNEDNNGDDIRLVLNDDAGITAGGAATFTYNDDSEVDLFLQLNDNSSFSITNDLTVTQTDAEFFEIEMNGASSISVGGDFTFSNTTTSDVPFIDMNGANTFTVSEDLIWTDNSDQNNTSSGFVLDSNAALTITDSFTITKTTDGHLLFYLNQNLDGTATDAQVSCNYLTLDLDNLDDCFIRLAQHSDITVTNDFILTSDETEADDMVEISLSNDAGIDVNGLASILVNSSNSPVDIDLNLNSSGAFDIAGNFTTSLTSDDIDIDMNNGCDLNIGGNWTNSITTGDLFDIDMADACGISVGGNWTNSMNAASNFDIFQLNTSNVSVTGDFTFTNTTDCQRFVIDGDDSTSFSIGEDMIIDNNSQDDDDGDTRITLDSDATFSVGDSLYINDTDDDQVQIQLNLNVDGAGNDVQMDVGYLVIEKNMGDDVQIVLYNDADLEVTNDFYVEVDDVDLDNNVVFTVANDAGVNIGGNMTFDVDNQPTDLDLDMNLTSSDSLNVSGNVVLNLTGDNIDIDMTDLYWSVGGNYTATVTSGDFYDVDMLGSSAIVVTGDYTISTDATSERIRHDLDNTAFITIGQDMILNNNSTDFESGETNIRLDRDAAITVSDSLFITDAGDDNVQIYLNQDSDGSSADAQLSVGYLVIDHDDGDALSLLLSNDADVTVTNDMVWDIDNLLVGNVIITMNGSSGIDVNGFVDINIATDSARTFDFNHNSSGDFDIAEDFRLTTNGEDVDVDMAGTGDWVIGDSLYVVGTDVDDYMNDITAGGSITVGSDWITSWTTSDYFDLSLQSSSSVAVTDRFQFTNAAGSGYVVVDLDGTSSLTAVDFIIDHNGSSNGQENGIWLDEDASMTITDSLFWSQNGDGLTRLHLNQNVDGAGADAQLAANSVTIDKDGGNSATVRLSQGSDITCTQNFTVDADNLSADGVVEYRMNNTSATDINGSLILSNNSSNTNNDVRIYNYSTGNLDVAVDADVNLTGDDIDIDITGGGDWLIGDDLTLDVNTGDDVFLLIDDSDVTVGDDWFTNILGGDDFSMDATGISNITVTDRLFVRLDTAQGYVQFDLDDGSSLSAVDMIVRDSTNSTDSENGIWIDSNSTVTLTDSLDWIQPNGGHLRMHLNQTEDGTGGADAQFSANSVTIIHGDADHLSVRGGDGSDITVTNNFSITGTDYRTDNHVEMELTDQAGVDINGSLLINVNSVNNTNIDLENFGSGDMDIAGNLDLDLTGNNIDIDYLSTGDLIVGGDALMDMNNANDLFVRFYNSAAFTIGDDWISNLTSSSDFELDIDVSADVSVNDRFVVTNDAASEYIRVDMENASTFSAVDVMVTQNSDSSRTSGFFLDSNAAMTITDSIYWVHTSEGHFQFYLNNAVNGSTDAQVSANSLTIDMDNGDDVRIQLEEHSDMTIATNVIMDGDNQDADGHVEIIMLDDAGFDINGNLVMSNTSSGNHDVLINHTSTGNLDVAGFLDIDVSGDDIDIDLLGGGDLIVGQDATMDVTNGDDALLLITDSDFTVGDDWLITINSSDDFSTDITGTGGVAVTDRIEFVNDPTSEHVQFDLQNDATLTAVDMIVRDSNSTADAENGIWLDHDASMTITDSVDWIQPNAGHFRLHLNQDADGSSADGQFAANSVTIVQGDGDHLSVRGGDGSDMTITNNLSITATDHITDNGVEVELTDQAGIDINGDLLINVNSINNTDIQLQNFGSGNLDVAGDVDLDITGDDIDVDYTGSGDLIVGGDLLMDMTNGDNFEMILSSSANFTIGDDWISNMTGSDNYDLDLSGTSGVAVTDRFVITNDASGDQVQVDLNDDATFSAVDVMVTNNTTTDALTNGFIIDYDAAVTVTDSIYWIQSADGNVYFFLNQNQDGSSADAQLSANSLTIDIDNGDDAFIRTGDNSDVTITTNLIIDADNLDDEGDVELGLSDDGAIDVNGNLILSNVSSNNNDVDIFHNSTGNIDVAGVLNIDVSGDDINIDLTGTGDLIVAGDVTMDLSNGDNLEVLGSSSSNFTFGDDWISTVSGSDNFDLDLSGSSQAAITDRFQLDVDDAGDQVQFDMAGTATFSAVDLDVNHDGEAASGIFLDGDAAMTLTDSISWIQTGNGALSFDLNQNSNGSSADGQLSASHMLIDKDSGNLLRIELDEDADITITNNLIITSDEHNGSQNVEFDLADDSGIDINGNVNVTLNASTSNQDIDFNHSTSGDFDIAGNFDLTINGGDDFDADISGSGDWIIGGDFDMVMTDGDDFDLDFTGTGNWTVGGDLTVDMSGGDIADFDLTNQAGLSVTGDVFVDGSSAASRRIQFDMANDASVNIGQDLTILNTTNTNSDADSQILIDGDATMVVSDSIYISHTGRDNLQVELNQSADGSGADAQLTASYLVLEMSSGDEFELQVSNDGDVNISNDLDIHYEDTHGTNDDLVVQVNDDATITVQGSAVIDYDNATGGSINDFSFDLNDNGQFNVGPSGGPYNTESFTMRMTIGDDINGRLDDDAQLNVYGDWNLIKLAGDDIDFDINASSGTGAQINVFGDFDVDNSENADDIYFDFNQNSLLDIEGDLDMLGVVSAGVFELQFDGSSELELAGNFVQNAAPSNFGTLDMNETSLLELNSTSVQQILPPNDGGGSDFFEYQRVLLNNSFGTVPQVSTGGEVTVTDSINFTDGVLYSSSDSLIILEDDGGVDNASDSSHTMGPFRKEGNEAFNFPVGNGEQYRLCGITAPSSGSDLFTATYFDQNPWPTYPGSSKAAGIDNVSSREYWIIDRDNGSSSVNVILSWDTNSGGVGNLDSLLVVRWDATATEWQNEGNAITTGDTVTGTIRSANVISTFSPFTLASTNQAVNALPIELLSFDAQKQDDEVLVSWTTATEINNDFFEVQRSADGRTFHTITTVPGAGNSATERSYEHLDEEPLNGWNYYRLKQVDYDGSYSYSEMRPVWFDPEVKTSTISIWPNPVFEKRFNVDFDGIDPTTATIELHDMVGRPTPVRVEINSTGFNVEILGDLATGYYSLHIHSEHGVTTRKLFVF